MPGLSAVKTFAAKHDGDCRRCGAAVTRGMEIALATPDDARNTRGEWIIIGCPAVGCSNQWRDAIRWWEQNAERLMRELPPPRAKTTPRAPYQPGVVTPPVAPLVLPNVPAAVAPTATPNGPVTIPVGGGAPVVPVREKATADEEFAFRYGRLDQFQRPIADLNPVPGVTRVLANAGSGKTTTMVGMSARWLREGLVQPERLILTTFTRKAGQELRARLSGVLSKGLFDRILHVGTFDSLAVRAVRGQVAAAHGWEQRRNVIDKHRAPGVMAAITYFHRAMGSGRIADLGIPGLDLNPKECKPRDYALAVDVLRSQKLSTVSPGARAAADRHGLPLLFEVWQLVEQQYRRSNAWNFADSMAAFYATVQARPGGFTLIVDEAQDNTLIQIDLSKALAYGGSLTMVGDVRQAIYSWRGAVPSLFAEEKQLARDAMGGIAKVKTVYLANNYRSAPQIVKLGNLIAKDQSWDVGQSALAARRKDLPTGPTVMVTPGGSTLIADFVREGLDAAKFVASDCAVLCRVRAEQVTVETECLTRKIPVQIVGGQSTFDSVEWQLFQSWLFFAMTGGAVSHDTAQREEATKYILRALDPIPDLGKFTAQDVAEHVFRLGATVQEGLRAKAADGRTRQRQRDACLAAASMLDAAIDADMHTAARNVASGLKPLLDSAAEAAAAKAASAGDDTADDTVDLLEKFVLVARQFEDLLGLYTFAEKCRANAKKVDADDGPEVGPLVVSTIHKAKGLEWKVVFVIANDKKFPHVRAQDAALEEERRLFYVACTRAEDLLVVTHDGVSEDGRSGGPSEFVELARPFDDTVKAGTEISVTSGPSPDPDAPQLPPVTLENLLGDDGYRGDASPDEDAEGPAPLPRRAADLITLLDAHADERAAKGGTDRKIGAKTVEVTLAAVQEVLAPLDPRLQTHGAFRDGTPFQHSQTVYEVALVGGGKVVVYTSVPRGATVAKGTGEDSMRVVLLRGKRASGDALVQRTKNWRVALADRIRDALIKYGES